MTLPFDQAAERYFTPNDKEVSMMDKLIEKAKQCVEGRWPDGNQNSYGDSAWRVRLFVLQGSPPKGFVLANYGTYTVKAFDSLMKHIYTFQRRW